MSRDTSGSEQSSPKPVRKWRWLVVLGSILLALNGIPLASVAWAYFFLNGKPLAQFIMKLVNAPLRGRLEYASIRWQPRLLVDFLLDRYSPVVIENLAMYDPRGTLVLSAPHVETKIRIRALLDNIHLQLTDLNLGKVYCLVATIEGPQPGTTENGFVSVFSSRNPSPPTTPGALSTERGPVIDLQNIMLDEVQLQLDFGVWKMSLDKIHGLGSFYYGGGEPATEGVQYEARITAASGMLTIGKFDLPLKNLKTVDFGVTSAHPVDLATNLEIEIAGAPVKIEGSLLHIYGDWAGIDAQVTTPRGYQVLNHMFAPLDLAGPAHLQTKFTGKLTEPLIAVKFREGEIGRDFWKLSQLNGYVELDTTTMQLSVKQLSAGIMDGLIESIAGMDVSLGGAQGQVNWQRIQPGKIHSMLSGKLEGQTQFRGNVLSPLDLKSEIKLRLKRSLRDILPRQIDLSGQINLKDTALAISDLRIRADEVNLVASGELDLKSHDIKARLNLQALAMEKWFREREMPPIIQALGGDVRVGGDLHNLHVNGNLFARGVGYEQIRLPELKAQVEFRQGVLELNDLRADYLGGKLEGSGSLKIFDGEFTKPLTIPELKVKLTAINFELAALGKEELARGRLSGDVEISGPLNKLSGGASLRLQHGRLLGEEYRDSEARFGVLEDRLKIHKAHLERPDGSGLDVSGDFFWDGQMALRLKAKDFPLLAIKPIADLHLGIAGKISGQVDVGGSINANPRLDGEIRLRDAEFRGMKLGKGELKFASGSEDISIDGQFFNRLFLLSGTITTDPRLRLHLTMNIQRFPVEEVVPEMKEIGDLHAHLSGRIGITADVQDGLTWAQCRLWQVEATTRAVLPTSRYARSVRLINRNDLVLSYDGQKLVIAPFNLGTEVEGQQGDEATVNIAGSVSPQELNVQLKGKVAIALAQMFLAPKVEKLSGLASLDVSLTGTPKAPFFVGNLNIMQAAVKLRKNDQPLQIHRAEIRLSPGLLRLVSMEAQMGRARVDAAGQMDLEKFKPTQLDFSLGGDLNFRLLEFFFPELVSHAAGMARVKLTVMGPIVDPQLGGEIQITDRFELSPRGSGRTLTFHRGTIRLSNYSLTTQTPLEGTYDEGLLRIEGEARLDQWKPADLYLKIQGTGIPQREPRVYSAEANFNVQLFGDYQQLTLQGDVDLVDARYIRDFDVAKQMFIKPRVSEDETPFYQGNELLENLALKLNVRSTGQLMVKNNYGQLSLGGMVAVSGVLSDPRLHGQIRVEQGTFNIPFLRGTYQVSSGEIAFSKWRPVEEGEINITSETLVTDRSSVDYQIRLKMSGPLNHIGIQLSSIPALDQGAIIALLAFGRTTDQLRTEWRSDSSQQAGGNQAAVAADAQVKQLTGDILNQIVEEPLKKVTRLDLARLEVGTESARLRAGKKIGRYMSVGTEYEWGLLGDDRFLGQAEVKMHDLLMLVGKIERVSTHLEYQMNEPNRGRMELKLKLPLR